MLTFFLVTVFVVFLLAAAIQDQFFGKVISDKITTTGTVLGIVAATMFPAAIFIPFSSQNASNISVYLNIDTGLYENQLLQNGFSWTNICLAISAWCLWYFAVTIMPYRKLYPIRKLFLVWIKRNLKSVQYGKVNILIFILGVVFIAFALTGKFGVSLGLYTSLAGFAFGVLFAWCVRIFAWLGIQTEALGFGDVVLFGMIGAWMGWQFIIPVLLFTPLPQAIIFLIIFLSTGAIHTADEKTKEGFKHVAFGPAIAISAIILLFAGWLKSSILVSCIQLELQMVNLLGVKGIILMLGGGFAFLAFLLFLYRYSILLFICFVALLFGSVIYIGLLFS